MKTQITNYVRAGYAGLFIVSHEEARVEAEMKSLAKTTAFHLYAWSITDGIHDVTEGSSIAETDSPFAMFDKFATLPEKSILILRDFHLILADPNPVIYRRLKDSLNLGKVSNRVIVIVGCRLTLPPELEKEITVIEFKLPDREQLRAILEGIADSAKIKLNGNTDKLLDAASGLTTTEAGNAFALAVVESGGKEMSVAIISREKCNVVRKSGLLEIIENKIALEDIGGLEHLKADLVEKRNLFTKEAREYGLPTPRGQLYVGQPGTGKSMCASATGSVFGIPIVRLEAGRIFGSLVGESERNWRTAFAIVKAISPCVLWIDEVDGLFSGASSSGHTDGGTTARVIKAILQDMQFNGENVFFVFTCNDIDALPDPLIDRLDVWSVDLPNSTERESIWAIHIEKRKRSPKKFNLPELAQITDGFSGRQIEQLWVKALTAAFNADREPNNNDVAKVAKGFVPTSVTMGEAIARRRKRLENRATPASAPEAKPGTVRKLATK